MPSAPRFLLAAGLTGALACPCAQATPAEAVHHAASGASAVANKVGTAVAHGAEKATSAVEHGLKKAATGVEHAASVTGRAVEKTAHKLGLPASQSH
jgi:hypothetical protein